jgi:hypothetical protein
MTAFTAASMKTLAETRPDLIGWEDDLETLIRLRAKRGGMSLVLCQMNEKDDYRRSLYLDGIMMEYFRIEASDMCIDDRYYIRFYSEEFKDDFEAYLDERGFDYYIEDNKLIVSWK